MPRTSVEVSTLEELRESGNYARIANLLTDDWRRGLEFEDSTIRKRLLAAELAGRGGQLDEMEAALAPYLDHVDHVPFGLSARVVLTCALYHYRRNEPSEALRLATLARTVAAVRQDEITLGEAVQLEGQAQWSLERWNEAAAAFEEAINVYAGQSRSYRLGLAYLYLGGVLNRIGRVEEARTTLERCIKILLKSHDDYSLAVARVNVALALNVMGEHETALKYLEFAYATFEQINHNQYSYLTLNNIATTLLLLREYDRAETYVSLAIEMGVKARSTQIASTYEIKAGCILRGANGSVQKRRLASRQRLRSRQTASHRRQTWGERWASSTSRRIAMKKRPAYCGRRWTRRRTCGRRWSSSK